MSTSIVCRCLDFCRCYQKSLTRSRKRGRGRAPDEHTSHAVRFPVVVVSFRTNRNQHSPEHVNVCSFSPGCVRSVNSGGGRAFCRRGHSACVTSSAELALKQDASTRSSRGGLNPPSSWKTRRNCKPYLEGTSFRSKVRPLYALRCC